MTEHENFLRHVALSVPELTFHQAARLTLAVIAWLKASKGNVFDSDIGLPTNRADPINIQRNFNAALEGWTLDLGFQVKSQDLLRVIEVVFLLEKSVRIADWSGDSAQWACDPDSESIVLAPYVADLMAFFSLSGGAPEVYLPFEEFGQLACRVRAKGAAASVDSKTPNQVQLGLVASGIYGQSIHHTDPVINPASVVGCELKKYSAASAVISLRGKYKKEDLDRDSYQRFDHASAKGPLAAVFHILAQTEGRVILLVPDSLLFKPGAERSLREYLLTRQRVEAVVSLPRGAAQGLKGACSILILNTVLASEQVLFVKVTNELLTNADTRTLKFRQVGALIRDRGEGRFSSLVKVNDLLTDDFNMEAARHVTGRVTIHRQVQTEFTTISEHFEIIRPRQHHMGLKGVPVEEVQAQDIPSFGLIRHATKLSVHDLDGPNSFDYFLKAKDVVICIKGAIGRVGCISKAPLPGPGGWVSGQSVAVLRSRGTDYAAHALMMYLRSPKGQAALRRLVVGTSAPTIQAKALKGFQIPILTAVQSDMALEVLEAETDIDYQIEQLQQKQSKISSFLWPD